LQERGLFHPCEEKRDGQPTRSRQPAVPDRIDPQSPPEVPVSPEPVEAPGNDLPGVEPPPPDIDIPDTPRPRSPRTSSAADRTPGAPRRCRSEGTIMRKQG
jgi:hypothetical protein